MHETASKFAGMTLKIKKGTVHPQFPEFGGSKIRIEDWWDRVYGKSWTISEGNPACIVYAMRQLIADPMVPMDDEVLYGKVGQLGHLIHVSELEVPK